MNITEFQNCLHKGFIDYQTAADAHYIPRLLTNIAAREEKVLDKILLQLDLCDSFFFSVAFVTKSGVACLKDKLLELEARQVKGRILASQYLNFTEPGALRELLRYDDAKDIIIVAHSGVCRALEQNINGRRVHDRWEPMDKGSFRIFEPFPQQPSEKVNSEDKHMTSDSLTMEAVLQYYE